MPDLNRRPFLALPLLALSGLPPTARAQAGAARLVVGFQPGGTGDTVARTFAEHWRLRSGQASVIVENRVGAGGVLAAQAVKAAAPDGLTLLSTPASVLTLVPHAARRAPFDALKDLVPVAATSSMDFALVAGPALKVPTFAAALDRVRSTPALALFATAGVGTMAHVIGLQIARRAHLSWVHTPYRGGGPALQDTIGGQVPLCIVAISELLLRTHREGRVRVLATAGSSRSRFMPDVPTLAESGMEGVQANDWTVVAAPAGLPAPLLARLSTQLAQTAEQPAYADALSRFMIEPLALGAEAAGKRLRVEYEAMERLVKLENIILEN
jgi:tripartite-type tricarboxylate transporter receptor subunit TctC